MFAQKSHIWGATILATGHRGGFGAKRCPGSGSLTEVEIEAVRGSVTVGPCLACETHLPSSRATASRHKPIVCSELHFTTATTSRSSIDRTAGPVRICTEWKRCHGGFGRPKRLATTMGTQSRSLRSQTRRRLGRQHNMSSPRNRP